MTSRQATPRRRKTASTTERHSLYERAVQDPTSEIEFVDRVFKRRRGRYPETLREDFCGTALFCAEWVRSRPGRSAIGVDLDAQTLRWGQRHRLDPLGKTGARVELVCEDVRSVETDKVDVVTAFNFSYSLIHERPDLLTYFKRARAALGPDGLFMLDFHAGPRSQEELVEETEHEDFTYVWEQGEMDALSGRARRAIHFHLDDGRMLRNAFRYEFRVWTVPELRDLLKEAGFERVDVYFEDFDERGYTTGPARKVRRMPHEDSWIGFLVAD